MTKFKYTLATAAIALAGAGLTSCSDFLDVPTDTRVELKTPEQLRMLLNSSYPQNNYAWICEIMSDNLEDNNAPDEEGMRYNLSPYNRGDDEMFRFEQCVSNSGSESPFSVWEAFYNSVASANHALEAAERMKAEDDERNNLSTEERAKLYSVMGEALMLRSYSHFILAQIFCMPYGGPEKSKGMLGIPYSDKPENTVKPHYERPTLAYTYERIVKDFEDGIKLINNSLYTQPKYHFNKAAAYAYGARLFLFMRQYNKAFNYANMAFGADAPEDINVANTANAFDASGYLLDTYSKLDSFYYLTDFGLYHNGVDKQGNFLVYPTYSVIVRHLHGSSRYGKIRNALNATMHGASPAWAGFKWRSSKGEGGTFTMHPCFNGCSFINGKSDYGLWCGVNVQEFFEYTDKVAGIGYCHVTKREFFGEETLFVRAEARLFLGDTAGALADLDLWEKNRRNCPSAAGNEDVFKDLTVESINKFYVDDLPADRNITGKDPETKKTYDNGYGIAKEINIDIICPESDAKVPFKSVEGMLQCIQHFRRIETLETGMRFFDLKRLGIEYSHFVGKDNVEYHMGIEDERKAIQIPADVIAAGFQANPRPEPIKSGEQTEKVERVR